MGGLLVLAAVFDSRSAGSTAGRLRESLAEDAAQQALGPCRSDRARQETARGSASVDVVVSQSENFRAGEFRVATLPSGLRT